MEKQNNILPNHVFDFSIFPLLEPKNAQERIVGRNHQKLMVVYTIESDPNEDLSFLKKVLSAVNIDLEKQVQLLGLTNLERLSCSNIPSFQSVEKLIVFGKSPLDLGIRVNANPYQSINLDNRVFLFSESLAKVAADKGKKGLLWNALKLVFQSN